VCWASALPVIREKSRLKDCWITRQPSRRWRWIDTAGSFSAPDWRRCPTHTPTSTTSPATRSSCSDTRHTFGQCLLRRRRATRLQATTFGFSLSLLFFFCVNKTLRVCVLYPFACSASASMPTQWSCYNSSSSCSWWESKNRIRPIHPSCLPVSLCLQPPASPLGAPETPRVRVLLAHQSSRKTWPISRVSWRRIS